MKILSHTKTQLIGLGVMILAFGVTLLYSKGYFDLTFIDRPGAKPEHTTRVEYTKEDYVKETSDPNADKFNNQIEDMFGDDVFEDMFGDVLVPDAPSAPEDIIPQA